MIGVVFQPKNVSKIECYLSKNHQDKKGLEGIFWKIWRIQVQIYPKTYIEPKYGAFYLKNKVSARGLVSLVQLS